MIHSKFKPLIIFSKSFGEFVAEIVVIVDKEEWDARGDTANAMSVEKALDKAAKSGRIGSLQVDTESLKLKEAGKLSIMSKMTPQNRMSFIFICSLISFENYKLLE